MSEIDIEDFKRFVANHEEINIMLDRCAYDLSSIVNNTGDYSGKQDTVNSLLDSLKKVKVGSRLSGGSNLKNKLDTVSSSYATSAASMIYALDYSEKKIDAYNKGEDVSEAATDMFNQVMKGLTDLNFFWVVNELTSKNPALSSVAFMMAYGTDAEYEGGDFVVGDGARTIVSEFWTVLAEEQKRKLPFKSALVGGGAVAVLTGARDIMLDEGKLTDLDITRTGIDVIGAGSSYASWVLITSAFDGLPGVLLASLASMVAGPKIDEVRDKIVGDNVINTFTTKEDGKEYKVYKNGNGKDGTYDVLFERSANENNNSHTLNNQTYTDYNYKSILYHNWEDLLPGGRGVYGDEAADQFNSYLQEIRESSDPSIVQKYEEQLNLANPQSLGNDVARFYDVLKQDGFDLQEYYDYYHGGLKK